MSDANAWLDSLQGSGIRPGLGRVRALLRALGGPQRAFPSIIVAGTNGKGSTSSTLASILTASGYRTGLYTSPHLVDIRERWTIDRTPISTEALERAIELLRHASDRAGFAPTYFEALTVIAFIAFREASCDVVVLEVGMGGRLDATNVVKPLAALITPIGLDHTEYLGNTLRKIAAEKAGVIHRGAIVLTSNSDPAVLGVLRRRAAKFGNRFVEVQPFDYAGSPLRGEFQRGNIALAVTAARELSGILPRIDEATIADGVRRTVWRGRLERFEIAGKLVVVDGCHNAHAARAVAPFLDATLPRPRLFVFGIMGDKDVADVTSTLAPLFDRVITTDPYPPRSVDAASLRERVVQAGVVADAEEDPAEAIARALASDSRSVFIGGSLYLAGAAIAILDEAR